MSTSISVTSYIYIYIYNKNVHVLLTSICLFPISPTILHPWKANIHVVKYAFIHIPLPTESYTSSRLTFTCSRDEPSKEASLQMVDLVFPCMHHYVSFINNRRFWFMYMFMFLALNKLKRESNVTCCLRYPNEMRATSSHGSAVLTRAGLLLSPFP